jgi:hypothetical protein
MAGFPVLRISQEDKFLLIIVIADVDRRNFSYSQSSIQSNVEIWVEGWILKPKNVSWNFFSTG